MKPFIPFTLEDIRSMSTDSSFSQGRSYQKAGAVGKIIYKENVFRGRVQGENNYKVAIRIRNDKPLFKCSCPYEYAGLCKHEVAFALAILDGNYTVEGQTTIDQNIVLSSNEFNSIFKGTDDNTKIQFLDQLLNKDASLRQQFLAFTGRGAPLSEADKGKPEVNIKEIVKKIHNEFKNMDFDDIINNAYEYEYDPYDEGTESEIASEMISEVFEKYSKKSKKAFEESDIRSALMYILACIESSFFIPHPIEEEYEVLGDSFYEEVSDEIVAIAEKFATSLEKTVLSDEFAIELMDLIVSRINIYVNPEREIPFADDLVTIEPMPYYFVFTNKILQAFLINENPARHLLNILTTNKWRLSELAFVYFKIAEILKDNALWLNTAEAYAPDDKKVALQLLEKYKNDKNSADFTRIARMTFENWPREFDKYISDNNALIHNESLYVKALQHYVKNKQSPEYYMELRKYLKQEQLDRFLSEISESMHTEFYVQLLEIEKRYETIMKVVKKNFRDDYRFHKLISPLLNVYPDECFQLLQDKIAITLDKERGRDVYQRICTWLGLMKEIPLKEEDTLRFINSVYNYKPNLPALKDEMRNAKLVSGKK